MKRLFIAISVFFAISLSLRAQEVFLDGRTDRLMIDLFSDIWSNVPSDMEVFTINRGVNISLLQDFRLGQSKFSIAAGLGLASHNLYSDHFYKRLAESSFSMFSPQQAFQFYKISDVYGEVKNNKLNLTYLNLPLEFRYRNNNLSHTLRFYGGLRFGYLINGHTKTHLKNEEGVFGPGTQAEHKIKEKKLGNLEKFQFGITGRIGYGRVNLYAYLPLTYTFVGNNFTEMKPFSIGLTFVIY